MIHDGMQYNLIQGQGHKPFKIGNPAVFKSYLLRHLQRELTTDQGFLNWGTISKFDQAGFLILSLVLCHVTLKLAEMSVVKSQPSVPYGANLL